VHTRFEIFKREMQDKLSAYKAAMPMAIAGALFIATAWFLITGAIVQLLHSLWDGHWPFLIVGFAYFIVGAAAGWFAYKEVTSQTNEAGGARCKC